MKKGEPRPPFTFSADFLAGHPQEPAQPLQPSAFLRLDSIAYPDPRGVSMKSTLIGFTSS